jgi:hypothetical protein
MYITIKLTPKKITAPTKAAILSKIDSMGIYTFSAHGHYYRDKFGFVIAYNMEKHRRKVKRLPNRGKEIIRANHWVAHIYHISETILSYKGCMIKQYSRNFTIITKEKM